MATVLMLLFGDSPGAPIVATSPTNPGFERHWDTLSEGVDEVIEARIYAGIHYRTSDEEGAQLGRRIARFVVNHALRASEPSTDDARRYTARHGDPTLPRCQEPHPRPGDAEAVWSIVLATSRSTTTSGNSS